MIRYLHQLERQHTFVCLTKTVSRNCACSKMANIFHQTFAWFGLLFLFACVLLQGAVGTCYFVCLTLPVFRKEILACPRLDLYVVVVIVCCFPWIARLQERKAKKKKNMAPSQTIFDRYVQRNKILFWTETKQFDPESTEGNHKIKRRVLAFGSITNGMAPLRVLCPPKARLRPIQRTD